MKKRIFLILNIYKRRQNGDVEQKVKEKKNEEMKIGVNQSEFMFCESN